MLFYKWLFRIIFVIISLIATYTVIYFSFSQYIIFPIEMGLIMFNFLFIALTINVFFLTDTFKIIKK